MGSIGVCNFKVLNMIGQKDITLSRGNYLQKSVRMRPLQYAPLSGSSKSTKAFQINSKLSVGTESPPKAADSSEESKSSVKSSYRIANLSEIEALVSEICDTDSIAEVELKLGAFELSVTRDLAKKAKPPSPQAAVPSPATVDTGDSNGSVTSTALVVSSQATSPQEIRPFLDRAADEGLVIVKSPRVGFFQAARITKKRGRLPNACKEKQIVKEGKVVCYIEQLGGQIPIQTDVSGEVIKILRKDGDAVGYGDPLIAILPSFPGIKKLK
ncbi:Biotin carboxyl carrier protein of acetyl-CoA carboxylase [Linum perenne]